MKSLLFFLIPIFLVANSISNYKPINRCVKFNSKEYLAIRSFDFNSKKVFLIVDVNSLKTGVVEQNATLENNCSEQILNSRYAKLLNYEKSLPHKLQNDGIVSNAGGVTITTDLCPSSKEGFEERLYLALIKKFKNPVPITVFITKRWIDKHQKEFAQLKQWDRDKNLSITWGNHTALHTYHPKFPLEHNFVLSPEENLTKDVLDLEVTLLENGVVPSIFFRFPGLVSDKKSVDIVTNLGLITIGSNTWLAKGEKLKTDSIILLHGNKNEPKGVDIFLKLLQENSITQPKEILNIHKNSTNY